MRGGPIILKGFHLRDRFLGDTLSLSIRGRPPPHGIILLSILFLLFPAPFQRTCIRWMRDLRRESAGSSNRKFIPHPLKLEEAMNRVRDEYLVYPHYSPATSDTNSHWIMQARLCKSTAINFWRHVLTMSGCEPIVILVINVARRAGI